MPYLCVLMTNLMQWASMCDREYQFLFLCFKVYSKAQLEKLITGLVGSVLDQSYLCRPQQSLQPSYWARFEIILGQFLSSPTFIGHRRAFRQVFGLRLGLFSLMHHFKLTPPLHPHPKKKRKKNPKNLPKYLFGWNNLCLLI